MRQSATPSGPSSATPPRADRAAESDGPTAGSAFALPRAVGRWLADGKAQGWSPRTLGNQRHHMNHFAWWLENEEGVSPTLDVLTPSRIRGPSSSTSGKPVPKVAAAAGPLPLAERRALRRSTPSNAFLRAFANFCLAEGLLGENPLRNVKPPRVPTDQIQPLAPEQVQALVDVARRTRSPERDVAIMLLLVDSGLRVSELCSLTIGDVDRGEGELWVTGKGNKRRRVFIGTVARRALWRYMEIYRRQSPADEALFVSVGGNRAGNGLTQYGVHRTIAKAGRTAGLTGVRCSPHTLGQTFAVNFLRGGGNLFELQQIMGHTDLTEAHSKFLSGTDVSQDYTQVPAPAAPEAGTLSLLGFEGISLVARRCRRLRMRVSNRFHPACPFLAFGLGPTVTGPGSHSPLGSGGCRRLVFPPGASNGNPG
jgi:site-specific recombinase XerC